MANGKKRRVPAPALVVGRGAYGGLAHRMVQYLEWQRVHNATAQGLRNRENQLKQFLLWCEERGVDMPEDISLRVLEGYQRHLYQVRKADGDPLSITTQCNRLGALKSFFRWLTRQHLLSSDPASALEMPRRVRQLPKDILSVSEMEQLLAWPDVSTPSGLRDRAMLEVLYSTGMRRMEVAGLTLNSISAEKGTVMIRQGKGRKDRLIPIGARACRWVQQYELHGRPHLKGSLSSDRLFLNNAGKPYSLEVLSSAMGRLIKRSGLRRSGSCHLLRHTMATHMLENGADTRWIQMMLGHDDISSTQVYTRVSIRALKEIHHATHPAELEELEELEQAEGSASGLASVPAENLELAESSASGQASVSAESQ